MATYGYNLFAAAIDRLALLLLAVRIGATRLIDNTPLAPPL